MVYSTEVKETEILCRNAKVFLDNDDHSIEIMLLKHAGQNCLEVIGYDQVQGMESNRIYLNAKKVRAKLSRKSIEDLSSECFFHTLSQQLQNDQLNRILDSLTVDFVLSRLNCIVAIEGGQFSITMNVAINESIKTNECGIVDFPSFQYPSLPTGVIPYRTNRPKQAFKEDSIENGNIVEHVEHQSPVRRPSVALPNVFATSGKMSPKHANYSSKGSVEAALAAARASLQPASSSVTIGGASDDVQGAPSNKTVASSTSAKPPTRRRTFEALTSLASKIIPSALVPINRQHSAGLRRSANQSEDHAASTTAAVPEPSSLFNRRKKDSSTLPSPVLPSLNVKGPSLPLDGQGSSPTVLIKPQPLSPISSCEDAAAGPAFVGVETAVSAVAETVTEAVLAV